MRLRHLALVLVAASSACKTKGTATPAAAPVTLTAAVQRDVPRVLEATGTVEPVRTARVEAQVSGIIDKVTFREGDQVTEGQVLFQVDPALLPRRAEPGRGRPRARLGAVGKRAS